MEDHFTSPLPVEVSHDSRLRDKLTCVINKCRCLLEDMRLLSRQLSSCDELVRHFAAASEMLQLLISKHDEFSNMPAVVDVRDTDTPLPCDAICLENEGDPNAPSQANLVSPSGFAPENAESDQDEVDIEGISSGDDDDSSLGQQPLAALKLRIRLQSPNLALPATKRMIGQPPVSSVLPNTSRCNTSGPVTRSKGAAPQPSAPVLPGEAKSSSFACDLCECAFARADKLKRHQLLHTDPAAYEEMMKQLRQRYPCDQCERSFDRPSYLRIHRLRHSDPTRYSQWLKTEKRRNTCGVCGASFKRPFLLRKHCQLKHAGSGAVVSPKSCHGVAGGPSREAVATDKKPSKRHVCMLCKASYDCPSLLALHELKHSDPSEYSARIAELKQRNTCDVCSATFRRPSGLRRHKISHLPKDQRPVLPGPRKKASVLAERPISTYRWCAICGARLGGKKFRLWEHINRRHLHLPMNISPEALAKKRENARRLPCDRCDRAFPHESKLKRHYLSHTDPAAYARKLKESRRKYPCDRCGCTFDRPSILANHLLEKHNDAAYRDTINKHVCDECGARFTGPKRLGQHKAKHARARAAAGKGDYACTVCGAKFPRRNFLKTHFLDNHPAAEYIRPAKMWKRTKPKKAICAICGRVLHSRTVLLDHMQKIHIAPEQRDYLCDKCPFRAKAQVNLASHMLTHSDEKNYTCGVCGFKTNKPGNLHAHSQYHKNLQFPCSWEGCLSTFNTKVKLRNHIKYVHVKPRNIQCSICSMWFIAKADLQKHSLTHNANTFFCTVCGISFNQKHNLNAHYKKITHLRKLQKLSSNEPGRLAEPAAAKLSNQIPGIASADGIAGSSINQNVPSALTVVGSRVDHLAGRQLAALTSSAGSEMGLPELTFYQPSTSHYDYQFDPLFSEIFSP